LPDQSWTVGQFKASVAIGETAVAAPENTYGLDYTGLTKCYIEGMRCAKATIPNCVESVAITMKINSPADPGWPSPNSSQFFDYTPPEMHANVETVDGRILPDVPGLGLNFNRVGIGNLKVERAGEVMTHGVATSLNNCPNSIIKVSPALQNCH
jgi:hypothetical protein